MAAVIIVVIPYDLAHIVDAECSGTGTQGIVEGGVIAAAVEEAMGAAGVGVKPDHLARVVIPFAKVLLLGAAKGSSRRV